MIKKDHLNSKKQLSHYYHIKKRPVLIHNLSVFWGNSILFQCFVKFPTSRILFQKFQLQMNMNINNNHLHKLYNELNDSNTKRTFYCNCFRSLLKTSPIKNYKYQFFSLALNAGYTEIESKTTLFRLIYVRRIFNA